MKSLGECIGVLEMACKCIKHKKKHRATFFPGFFLAWFCFSGTTFQLLLHDKSDFALNH